MSPPPTQLALEEQDPHHKYSEHKEYKQIQSKLDVPKQKQHQQQQHQPKLTNSLILRNKPKLAKCMSIVHLFGNAYSTQQYASRHKDNDMTTNGGGRTAHITREHPAKSKLERFKHRSENQMDGTADATQAGVDVVDHATPARSLPIEDFCDDKDLGARAFRTISKVIHTHRMFEPIHLFRCWVVRAFFFSSLIFSVHFSSAVIHCIFIKWIFLERLIFFLSTAVYVHVSWLISAVVSNDLSMLIHVLNCANTCNLSLHSSLIHMDYGHLARVSLCVYLTSFCYFYFISICFHYRNPLTIAAGHDLASIQQRWNQHTRSWVQGILSGQRADRLGQRRELRWEAAGHTLAQLCTNQ